MLSGSRGFKMLSDVQRSLIEEMLPRPTDATEYKLSSLPRLRIPGGNLLLRPRSGKHPRLFALEAKPQFLPGKKALGGEATSVRWFQARSHKFCIMKRRP